MKLCAKHKVPTVIFYDDSEQILSMPSAEVLNFLSGINTPNNPKGAMIIFTSNMTQHIEDRILRRPGRIDRIFNIHPLTGYDLLTCAKMYFNFLNWEEKSDKEWIDLFMVKHKEEDGLVGMTGAEIQGLAQSCYAFANSSGAETINYELIKRLKETIQGTFTEAYHMIAQNSLARRYDTKKISERAPIGFNKSSEDSYAF